nr:hypothetical protein [uncultured Oscillibacter sp.]
MNLKFLSVSGDRILDRRIREASNYCDSGHLFRMTSGIARLVLAELSPIDLDGCEAFTVCANVDQPLTGKPGYNVDPFFKVSFYNLDRETSQALYRFREADAAFSLYAAGLLLDILAEVDQAGGGKNHLPERREEVLDRLRACGFHRDILLENFSKISGNRTYKALVYRCLDARNGESLRVDLIRRSSGETLASKWMTARPGTVFQAEHICRTYWEAGRFHLIQGKRGPRTDAFLDVPAGK